MAGDYSTQFLQALIAHEIRHIEIGFVAKIVSFDAKTMLATIKPMLKGVTEEAGKDKPNTILTPDIEDVPVQIVFAGSCYIRPDYLKGDLVKVACTGSSIDDPIDDDVRADTMDVDRFSLDNCVVTGSVVPKNADTPAAWGNSGLLIGKGASFIRFTDLFVEIEGDLVVKGNLIISGNIIGSGSIQVQNITALQDITAGQNVIATTGDVIAGGVSLKTHTHPVILAPGETGPPS